MIKKYTHIIFDLKRFRRLSYRALHTIDTVPKKDYGLKTYKKIRHRF